LRFSSNGHMRYGMTTALVTTDPGHITPAPAGMVTISSEPGRVPAAESGHVVAEGSGHIQVEGGGHIPVEGSGHILNMAV